MIFVTGDTHIPINVRKLDKKNFKEQKELTKNDFVIICGDFGGIWDGSKHDTEWLDWLNKKNFTTLFVDGNHENFELLNSYPVEIWNGGKVHFIRDSIIHLMRGQIFNIDGNKIFTFGGGTSIDKMYRAENISWWKEELPTIEELEEGIKNLEKCNFEVDYVITHSCSKDTLEEVGKHFEFFLKTEPDSLNRYFYTLQMKLKYKHWYFGHYHNDIYQVKEKQTLLFHKIIKLGEVF